MFCEVGKRDGEGARVNVKSWCLVWFVCDGQWPSLVLATLRSGLFVYLSNNIFLNISDLFTSIPDLILKRKWQYVFGMLWFDLSSQPTFIKKFWATRRTHLTLKETQSNGFVLFHINENNRLARGLLIRCCNCCNKKYMCLVCMCLVCMCLKELITTGLNAVR